MQPHKFSLLVQSSRFLKAFSMDPKTKIKEQKKEKKQNKMTIGRIKLETW